MRRILLLTAGLVLLGVCSGKADDVRLLNTNLDSQDTITVTLPKIVDEGDGHVEGSLLISSLPTEDLIIELTSSNPEKIKGQRILLPEGINQISFALEVLDNLLIEGVQSATIGVSTQGYSAGEISIFIQDDESKSLYLSLPDRLAEGQSVVSNTATVFLDGIAITDLHVLLESSDATELVVPTTVTIPAGESNAVFSVTVIDDPDMDGRQYPVITASVPGYLSAAEAICISDNELASFLVTIPGEDLPENVPVQVSIKAKSVDGYDIPDYAGKIYFGAQDSSKSALPLEATSECDLIDGLWQGAVTIPHSDTSLCFQVNDGLGHLGSSGEFDLFKFRAVKMATDWTLPYIYMIHTSATVPNKSRLIWYNTETHSIEKVLDAGENATDLTVHYGDNRIYVSNWQRAETRVFDRLFKQELD
ncbi:MAG: hypothetical protein JXR23_05985, partial [Pontiellaceae bacterium]|nr:hypothetical protein [Pontiellaceae bacterium]